MKQEKQKRIRKNKKRLVMLATLIQLVFLIYLNIFHFKHFFFGNVLTIIFIMINTMIFNIKVSIVDSTMSPKNDPGICIWWLFNLRFGQKGHFTEKHIYETVLN